MLLYEARSLTDAERCKIVEVCKMKCGIWMFDLSGIFMGLHTHQAPVFHSSPRGVSRIPLSFVGITQGLCNPAHPTTPVVERLQLHCVLADTLQHLPLLQPVNNYISKSMLSVSGDIPHRVVQNSWGTTQERTKVTFMKKIGNTVWKI